MADTASTGTGGARRAGTTTPPDREREIPRIEEAEDREASRTAEEGRAEDDGRQRPAVRVGNRPGVDAIREQRRDDEGKPPPDTKREETTEVVLATEDVSVHYGDLPAVQGVTMRMYQNEITALIGPSGCGKSTLIRCFDRMNDLIPSARVDGKVTYHGEDIYGPDVDPVEVRRRIGMVFQKPNPFPKSIYDNVAFGPRQLGIDTDMDELVETSLKRAALWEEVKNKLRDNAYGLSGGQQQRLCIARTIAVSPDVILMDEPCSALDPVSTGKIEDLMRQLTDQYTIVIVTHNMQQAARISDRTAFFTTNVMEEANDHRYGVLVEYDLTDKMFSDPADTRTEQYVSGRFG